MCFGVAKVLSSSACYFSFDIVDFLTFGSYFIMGSLPSVVPFACTTDPQAGVIASAILCCIACFAVGAIKTITTKGNVWTSGFENLFFAGAGAGLSYGIGALYEHYRQNKKV